MILVELIPRDYQSLVDTAQHVMNRYPSLSGINIPDIVKLPHRSYTIARDLTQQGYDLVIPHLRCIDTSVGALLDCINQLIDTGVQSVLLVSGDNHPNHPRHPESRGSVETIQAVKTAYPHLTVYAALDPYRQSCETEYQYCQAKLAAGCDGFFSQPFFSCDQARYWLDQLADTRVFLGLSPVITERSKLYWERVNHVVFSPDFSLTTQANIDLGRALIQLANDYQQNSYIMPIKIDIVQYLDGLFLRD